MIASTLVRSDTNHSIFGYTAESSKDLINWTESHGLANVSKMNLLTRW